MTPQEIDNTMEPAEKQAISMEEIRTRLAAQSGPAYWRHLDELAGRSEIDALVHREFPSHVTDVLDPVSRRNFIKLMGASMMLAGLANCARQPSERIVPFVKAPEESIPGKPQYYATAMPFLGYGIGLLATSYEGRPTKLEGHPEHPSSLGATHIFAQSTVLDLYDPDRLDTVLRGTDISTWSRVVRALLEGLTDLDVNGTGLYILSQTQTSPAFARQMQSLRGKYANLRWHQWDPASANGARVGSQLAFGEMVDTLYDFRAAKVVVSLDSNFLLDGPAHVRYAHDFADARDADLNGLEMNRLYVAESSPTLTGAGADHRVPVRYPDVETLARILAEKLGVPGVAPAAGATVPVPESWLAAAVADLQASAGRGIVIAGDQQPGIVHALAHAINAKLGNDAENGVIRHVVSAEVEPVDQFASLTQLVADMNAGKVRILVILGGNPVFNSPGDVDFAAAMANIPLRVHLTEAGNETSLLCHWSIPAAHSLEAWGDVRGHDGTVSLIQPLILPLYEGKTAEEILEVLMGHDTPDSHEIVRRAWRQQRGEENFESFWQVALSRGMIENTASAPKAVTLTGALPAQAAIAARENLDILFRLDPCILDGRYANNGWLQELPKPLTQLTWDTAVYVHPRTAHRLQLEHEDLVEVEYQGRKVTAPVMFHFGHPEDAISVNLGYGRRHAGRVGTGVGFDFYSVQTVASPWFGTGVSLRKLGKKYSLANTSEHWNVEQSMLDQGNKAQDRHLIREAALDHYKQEPDFAIKMGHPAPDAAMTLYNPSELPYNSGTGNAWGMTIDLNRCTGCNACLVACVAENNIAVVGKEEVRRGREMHWIRIDRYYKGDFEGQPEVTLQPMPCMQCENAPCEPVCPVVATSHSNEGLNDMVYNRCIGTRYCLNNCPYKVRRFNFFKYSDHTTPTLKLMRNPNVTVRSRGVMEKCTYCVQRINIARIDAKREDRNIADGEAVTACQSVCPSRAIVFGNINDPEAAVTKMKANKRNYGLLADIGTRPRTTYLAQLRNPSPALAGETSGHGNQAEH